MDRAAQVNQTQFARVKGINTPLHSRYFIITQIQVPMLGKCGENV